MARFKVTMEIEVDDEVVESLNAGLSATEADRAMERRIADQVTRDLTHPDKLLRPRHLVVEARH